MKRISKYNRERLKLEDSLKLGSYALAEHRERKAKARAAALALTLALSTSAHANLFDIIVAEQTDPGLAPVQDLSQNAAFYAVNPDFFGGPDALLPCWLEIARQTYILNWTPPAPMTYVPDLVPPPYVPPYTPPPCTDCNPPPCIGCGPPIASAPEASTWAMVLTGFALLAYASFKRRRTCQRSI